MLIAGYINKLNLLKEWINLHIDGGNQSFDDFYYEKSISDVVEEMNKKNDADKLSIIITDHAYDRAKERLSMNRTSFAKLSERAFETGVTHGDAAGNLRRYLDKLFLTQRKANNIRIYGENVFFFHGNVLMTVYQVPNNLRKSALKIQA